MITVQEVLLCLLGEDYTDFKKQRRDFSLFLRREASSFSLEEMEALTAFLGNDDIGDTVRMYREEMQDLASKGQTESMLAA